MARTLTEEHKRAMARGRAKKAEARRRAEAEERQRQLQIDAQTIDERVERAERAYTEAMAKAARATTVADINRLYDIADRRQGTLIRLSFEQHKILHALS